MLLDLATLPAIATARLRLRLPRADAFRRLGIPRPISLVHPANRASIPVAEKLGERFQHMIEFQGIEVGLQAIDNPEGGSNR